MEIHISSLAYDPAIYRPNGSERQQAEHNQNSNQHHSTKPVERAAKVMPDADSLQQKYELTKKLSKPDQIAEIDLRKVKALSAYAATLNLPIQEEKQALAGIDFFV